MPVPCKKPADPSDSFLARMNVNFITPPYTAHAIKRCLCFAEQLLDHMNIQLFMNLSSELGLDDKAEVSILTGDGPGFTPDDPMALVRCPPSPKPTQTQKRYRLRAKYNRHLHSSDTRSMEILTAFIPLIQSG
jgi:hypothetical protein